MCPNLFYAMLVCNRQLLFGTKICVMLVSKKKICVMQERKFLCYFGLFMFCKDVSEYIWNAMFKIYFGLFYFYFVYKEFANVFFYKPRNLLIKRAK